MEAFRLTPQDFSHRTRREFARGLGAAVLAAGFGRASVSGPEIGVISYSFRDRPIADAIRAMSQIGIRHCEFWEGHLWPAKPADAPWEKHLETVRRWRREVPLDEFRKVRRLFEEAGIRIIAYTQDLRKGYDDAEVAKTFQIAATLGVKQVFSSANVSMAKRLNDWAGRYGMVAAVHNHSVVRPDEFTTPDDFDLALRGNPHLRINLDVGHFVAAGFEPVEFIRKRHRSIAGLHIKDRKKNQGATVPLGEGDTPVREILLLLKRNKYDIPCILEYEHLGADTVEEVRRSYEYCKRILED